MIELAVVSTSSGVEDSYRNCSSNAEKAKIRGQEQRQSCRFFGLDENRITFLDFLKEDQTQPIEISENTEMLRKYISAKQPDIVFLPHGNDTNASHKRMYLMLVVQLQDAIGGHFLQQI